MISLTSFSLDDFAEKKDGGKSETLSKLEDWNGRVEFVTTQ